MIKKSLAKAGIVMIIGALSSIAALVAAECVKNSSEALAKAKAEAEAGSESDRSRS